MLICAQVPDILDKVFFKALPQFHLDKRCKACGNKTMYSLTMTKVFYGFRKVFYPCCRKIECYNKVVKNMELDILVFKQREKDK